MERKKQIEEKKHVPQHPSYGLNPSTSKTQYSRRFEFKGKRYRIDNYDIVVKSNYSIFSIRYPIRKKNKKPIYRKYCAFHVLDNRKRRYKITQKKKNQSNPNEKSSNEESSNNNVCDIINQDDDMGINVIDISKKCYRKNFFNKDSINIKTKSKESNSLFQDGNSSEHSNNDMSEEKDNSNELHNNGSNHMSDEEKQNSSNSSGEVDISKKSANSFSIDSYNGQIAEIKENSETSSEIEQQKTDEPKKVYLEVFYDKENDFVMINTERMEVPIKIGFTNKMISMKVNVNGEINQDDLEE